MTEGTNPDRRAAFFFCVKIGLFMDFTGRFVDITGPGLSNSFN
jgi:hypothetical protein